jgi:hypothetical protein
MGHQLSCDNFFRHQEMCTQMYKQEKAKWFESYWDHYLLWDRIFVSDSVATNIRPQTRVYQLSTRED